MGFKKIGKANISGLSLSILRKSKSKGVVQHQTPIKPETNNNNPKYEFKVTSNPKEYTGDNSIYEVITQSQSASESTAATTTCDDEQSNDNNSTGGDVDQAEAVAWGWFMNACWGGSSSKYSVDKRDDADTFQSSVDCDDDDDASGESSQPSFSMLDQILSVKAMTSANDDISDVTSVPSIDDSTDSEDS